MPVITTGVQYSGLWSLSSQANAKALGTWASQPPVGAIWVSGVNTYGQLGLGNRTSYSSPKQIGASTAWYFVQQAKTEATLAVKIDGTLWSWGLNDYGQLGLGNITSYSSPKQVGSLTDWSSIGCSGNTSNVAAIKTDGTLWTWGDNNDGGLGQGNITNKSSPVQVGALTNWSQVTGGESFMAAIKTNGTLWTWGKNDQGQLGLGNVTKYSSPKQVGALTNWSKVTGGQQFVLAVKTDGTLWSWGSNENGQLGNGTSGTFTRISSPTQVGALTNWAYIETYTFNVLALKTDGTLWSWGYGLVGCLGLGNTTSYSSPKQVGALTTWSSIKAGSYVSRAIKTDGTLWSWGNNADGYLGDGTITNRSSPVQIGALATWLKLSSGSDLVAIKS